MRAKISIALSLFLLSTSALDADELQHVPKLLLNARRLHRLQLDRDRQTIRWVDFETRVRSVADSPERGFELALYYAVTHNEQRGKEAIAWALAHACDPRQFAWILDWCGELMSSEQRKKLEASGCAMPAMDPKELVRSLENGGFANAQALYADCEYLIALRASGGGDPRESAVHFFSGLPIEFLLSLKPEQVEHPNWRTHVAALTLVAVDPNLEGSQYLQAWAIEDRQMIREGPGVAYEFLWADPYLPGVGYQNLEPWFYDTGGPLFARRSWDPQACWIAISSNGIKEENCPSGWRDQSVSFGHLLLIPMTDRCVEIPALPQSNAAILWRLKPGQTVVYREVKRSRPALADSIGMVRVSAQVAGKVCAAR